jgi:hypothetical protein
MEKYAIFHIEGGLGKHIAATAVAKTIKNNHKDRKLIIVCSYPEIFVNLPCVWRVYRNVTTSYFYDDFVKDKDSLIFKHEPYFTTEHIHGKLPLIQNWCNLYNLNWLGEMPEVKFNLREQMVFQKKWAREKPIFLIQTNGGPLLDQPFPYSWTRDMPPLLSRSIVEQFKKDYHIIQICRNELNFIDDVEVQSQPMSNMELLYLLTMSEKRLLIDSSLQHGAAALKLPSTVLWVATNPKIFGYDLHDNIVANISKTIPLPDSYLFDYNFHGSLHECPIFEGDILFDFDKIINSLTK